MKGGGCWGGGGSWGLVASLLAYHQKSFENDQFHNRPSAICLPNETLALIHLCLLRVVLRRETPRLHVC